MNTRVIRSSSFPASFFRVFYHVAETQQPLVINNLENEEKRYVNLRARLNEFRKAYHNEALASGNQHQIELADKLYGVVCRQPERVDGKWQLSLEHKHEMLGKALDDIIPDGMMLPEPELMTAENAAPPVDPEAQERQRENQLPKGVGEAQTKALSELYDEENKKG